MTTTEDVGDEPTNRGDPPGKPVDPWAAVFRRVSRAALEHCIREKLWFRRGMNVDELLWCEWHVLTGKHIELLGEVTAKSKAIAEMPRTPRVPYAKAQDDYERCWQQAERVSRQADRLYGELTRRREETRAAEAAARTEDDETEEG
jgi:hypothetical protein